MILVGQQMHEDNIIFLPAKILQTMRRTHV